MSREQAIHNYGHGSIGHTPARGCAAEMALAVEFRASGVKEMQEQLQAYYMWAFPEMQDAWVSEPVSISNGWESDVYAFKLEEGSARARRREELVLRVYPGEDADRKSAREFEGMRKLYEAGYPVPEVLTRAARVESPFGRPFVIMERIEGKLMWPVLSGASPEKQRELLGLFCELFVRLHGLDWTPFADEAARQEIAANPYLFIDRWLAMFRAYESRFSIVGFQPVLAWLEARRDQAVCERPAPIHWDFHPGNLLLRADGSAVVIDWTQLEVSDARFDLAWTLLLTGTHESMAWRNMILAEYERLRGTRVKQLEFFEVAACLKRLASVVISLTYGPEKLGMRPEAVPMMRQRLGAIKKVYGLLVERTGIKVAEAEALFQ